MRKRFINNIILFFLVAIYKTLSGTINTCGDECPTNCKYFL